MRSRHQPEYELMDTGVFDQDRYFDVFVEYAKASPEDILIRCTVHNRGSDPATLDVLPPLWFRNEWSGHADAKRPTLAQVESNAASVRKAICSATPSTRRSKAAGRRRTSSTGRSFRPR